jgi:hypothetical protein
MADPILAHLRDELIRVMHENAETLREEASVSPSEETLAQQERSLALVRAVSADFLAALRREIESRRPQD